MYSVCQQGRRSLKAKYSRFIDNTICLRHAYVACLYVNLKTPPLYPAYRQSN
jgi:hypothetical protein